MSEGGFQTDEQLYSPHLPRHFRKRGDDDHSGALVAYSGLEVCEALYVNVLEPGGGREQHHLPQLRW